MSRIIYIESSCIKDKYTGISRTINKLIQAMEECGIKVERLSSEGKLSGLRSFLYFNFLLPRTLCKLMNENDIFLIPNNMGKFWRLPHKNTWVLMHDIIPLTPYGQYSLLRKLLYRYKTRQIRNAGRIITISEYVKKCLIDSFEINPQCIKVLYWGAFTKVEYKKWEDTGEPYFLSIGTGEYRKKAEFLINNWPQIYQNKYKLKLFGKECKPGAHASLLRLIDQVEMRDYIELLGPISDEEMNYLYSQSCGLIFPSFEEGFGLPPIEALRCGCNVILPKTPINYELYGEVGIFYSLGDVEELVDCVKEADSRGSSHKDMNKKFCDKFSADVFKNRVNKLFNIQL